MIVIKRPTGFKLLLKAANAAAYPAETSDPLNVDLYWAYADEPQNRRYAGTYPPNSTVKIPLATDQDRDVVVTTMARSSVGVQQRNDPADAPSTVLQSEREQRKPVIGIIRDATNTRLDIGVSFYPRHMRARRIIVASDAGFTSIVATYYEDVDKASAETPRLPEVFRLIRAVPGTGTATYYVKVAHSSFSTALRTEATQQLKLEALRWGPDSDPLTVTFADSNGAGGSTGTFNPFIATIDGYGGAPSTFLLTIPLAGEVNGVTGSSGGFADRLAIWTAGDTLNYSIPILADRQRGYVKASGFSGTVGAINVKTDYLASGSAYETTGTINSGQNTLVVPSSSHDFRVGEGIAVTGAGTAGAILYTSVQSISSDGLTITLNNNASTSVVAALVRHDDTSALSQAFADAPTLGKSVHIPAGTYWTDNIQLTSYYWRIYGEGPGRSVLRAREANQTVLEITAQTAHTITMENFSIIGAGQSSGSSGHGIWVHDNSFEAYNVVLRNLMISGCGGKGVYLAQHFTTMLERVYVYDCGDNGIELQGNNTCRLVSCYVHGVPAGKAAYRIYGGWPILDSCNGVDSAGSWGVFGREFSEDGADNYCFPTIRGCNVEGWGLTQDTVAGIRFKVGSYPSLLSSTTFYAGASGTNLMAIKMDFIDAGNAPILDSSVQFYAAVITQFKNSQPVHSNGVPFVVFGSPLSSYHDTSAGADRTLPNIKSNLIAGSTNAALLLSRAKIAALEASSLVGDLSGGQDFAGNNARVLVKGGTVSRPAIGDVDDPTTGWSFTTAEAALSVLGTGKAYFNTSYTRLNTPLGVNTFPGAGYALHTTGGVGLIDNTGGGGAPTLELKNGTNPHLLVNDAVNGLTGRLGTLNTVNQVFAGSMSNHDFLIFVNGAETWRFRTSGHLTPGAAGTQDVGTASLPIRDLVLSRNIVFPAGIRQNFAPDSTNAGVNVGILAGDPASPQNGDYWYNSSTGKQRTHENGVSKDVVVTGGGNLSGTLTSGRVALSGGASTVTDSANMTFDLTSLIVSKAGGNPNVQLNDTTNGINTRLGPLAGAPDRGAVGTFSNHPFVVYVDSAESWQFSASHHLTPMNDNARDLGAAATRVRDGYFGTSVKTPKIDYGSSVVDLTGSGSPEGVVTAAVGSTYRRTNGGTATTFYVKESGTGSTGWVVDNGASVALSNLASVAINQSLTPNADNTLDLGSSANSWRDLWADRDLMVGRRIVATGSAPSTSTGTGAGTSPSLTVDGNEICGAILLTTGTSPATNSKILDMTVTAYTNYPVVMIFPGNAAAATAIAEGRLFVDDASMLTTKWTLKSGATALSASTDYVFYYQIKGF